MGQRDSNRKSGAAADIGGVTPAKAGAHEPKWPRGWRPRSLFASKTVFMGPGFRRDDSANQRKPPDGLTPNSRVQFCSWNAFRSQSFRAMFPYDSRRAVAIRARSPPRPAQWL